MSTEVRPPDASPPIETASPRASPLDRFRAHLRYRYRRPPGTEAGRYTAAVRSTRPLVYAEALAFFVVMMSVDEYRVLRLPAFLVAIGGAVLILAVAGLLHGASLRRSTLHLDRTAAQDRFDRTKSAGRAALLVVALGATVWLVVFSAGVPPWVA